MAQCKKQFYEGQKKIERKNIRNGATVKGKCRITLSAEQTACRGRPSTAALQEREKLRDNFVSGIGR